MMFSLMTVQLPLLYFTVAICTIPSGAHSDGNIRTKRQDQTSAATMEEVLAVLRETQAHMARLNNTVKLLARQQVLSQFYIEEKTRSDGDSGVKQVRRYREGTRPYYVTSHTGSSFLAMHDHSNNIRTVGMGEFVAVMNGQEYRTRHNDYRLYMPSTTSQNLHKTEEIPFPGVPPEVTSKATIEEQIAEMREWFKAWRDGDRRVRDYTKYFIPVMTYLEGAWTYANEQVDESFASDRHQIDAKNWFELEEKVRFNAYSGAKQSAENIPYLPKVIMNITNDYVPIFAQWNYRIACHPINRIMELNRFRVVDDLQHRMQHRQTIEEYEQSKMARFSLNPVDRKKFIDKSMFNKFLDQIMNEIPGKNNYPANLFDYGSGVQSASRKDSSSDDYLNAGYYHRRYVVAKDASGRSTRYRGFADPNLYMALTDHSKIVGMDNMQCFTDDLDCNQEGLHQKWTYAFPLEVVYLTPLSTWNPYGIEYKGRCKKPEAVSVSENGATGTFDKPFNGICDTKYFITPNEFFDMDESNPDPADTTPKDAIYVLDSTGTKRAVRAAGVRILFPDIPGVGKLRQRYPIAPVHGEGSSAWKEVEALQDIVMQPKSFRHMLYESDGFTTDTDTGGDVAMKTAVTTIPSQHSHTFALTENQRELLDNGETVVMETDQASSHTHKLQLKLDEQLCGGNEYMYRYITCDDKDECWDKHPFCVFVDQ